MAMSLVIGPEDTLALPSPAVLEMERAPRTSPRLTTYRAKRRKPRARLRLYLSLIGSEVAQLHRQILYLTDVHRLLERADLVPVLAGHHLASVRINRQIHIDSFGREVPSDFVKSRVRCCPNRMRHRHQCHAVTRLEHAANQRQ